MSDLAEYVERVVDEAPPLTPGQRDRIGAILNRPADRIPVSPRTSAVASCIHCRRVVCVVDSKYAPPKLRRHKDDARQPCNVEATKQPEWAHARRQAAYTQRHRAALA